MSGSVLLHRQLSPEDLQQLLAWYKIRDILFGDNCYGQDVEEARELASVCEHPNAVWLTKLFGGRDVASPEEARRVFRSCENDPRALCFAAVLVRDFEEVRRAAELGDAFAQAWMASAWETPGEECFRWAEKSAAQGERDGFFWLGYCSQHGKGCEKDVEISKETFLLAVKLGDVYAMVCLGELFDKNDPQRFVWFGRAAAKGESDSFLDQMSDQVRNFGSGIGHADVVFAIGRAVKGHIDSDERTIFGEGDYDFDSRIDRANQALRFYQFQLQSYRKAVDSWTIIGFRNKVVKDIRKMIGKMIWDVREEAAYLEKK
jgi:hypothetical protein